MTHNTDEAMTRYAALPAEYKATVDACMQLLLGETPDDPLAILNLNRVVIQMQRDGNRIPAGIMPRLAGLALNIIDGVADRADRSTLKSYYWRAEDVQKKKIPDVLRRNGFRPA